MVSLKYRQSVRGFLRDRVLDAAQTIAERGSWAAVTMSKIADAAGVSRQTVYNEFGSKPDLADALVARELGKFLEVVREQLVAHHDVVEGLRGACEGALTLARSNPLLKATLSSVPHETNDLFPLLTTRSQGIIDVAVTSVVSVVNDHYGDIGLTQDELTIAADMAVRLVLSHLMRPALTPAEVADQIAWIFGRLLR